MQRDFALRKRLIIAGLAALVVVDFGLAAYSWRLSAAPRTPRQLLVREKAQLNLLHADVHRAEAIRDKMPSIQLDCEKFEHSLRTANSGYSDITAEVYGVAGKAALRIDDLTFKQKPIPNRNLDVVDMEATVTGEYSSVVRFINGLQRSENIYEIDGLSLTEDSQNHAANGPVRVTVHMKTYFRSA
jgi:Tfp pilus assembly protein PilO